MFSQASKALRCKALENAVRLLYHMAAARQRSGRENSGKVKVFRKLFESVVSPLQTMFAFLKGFCYNKK